MKNNNKLNITEIWGKNYENEIKISDLDMFFDDIKYYKYRNCNEYYAVLPNGIWYFLDPKRHREWILPTDCKPYGGSIIKWDKHASLGGLSNYHPINANDIVNILFIELL